MTRITFLGEEIQHDNRDRKGRYAKKSRLLFFIFILLGVSILAFNTHFNAWYDRELTYIAPVYADSTMEAKVEAMKESIVDKIQACESAGHTEDEAIIIIDNGQLSLGTFQFFRPTIQHYYKTLYNQEITMKEAAIIAFDDVKARQLAYDIIWDVEGGIWEWENCARKTNVVPEIEVIKKLEQ